MPHRPHWTNEDVILLHAAQNHGEMLGVALGLLRRTPQPIVQVCGPISTGGRGSIEANLDAFARAIDALHTRGFHVFDQTPFEEPIRRIHYQKNLEAYPEDLLTHFYLPILESGLIAEAYFLPGWEASHGASWEHREAARLGLAIRYFSTDWEDVADCGGVLVLS